MDRNQINNEIKETLGIIPTMFKSIPDSTLEEEWNLFKKVGLGEGPIPNKERELIGIGISAVTKCKYCVYFHTEVAKLFGATDEEIEAAIHYSKHTAGWSAYVNGLGLDFNEFKNEIDQVTAHAAKMHAEKEKEKEMA